MAWNHNYFVRLEKKERFEKMNKRIWLSPPHMGGKEEHFFKEAFESNWIAPLGPMVDGLEYDLAAFLGIGHVAALSSGTAAIHLALIILGIKPGDEVIAPSFTFSATVNPIVYQGAIPVLVDSEPGSWNMDPGLLEEAIHDRMKNGKKPAAIIVVDLYGMPADFDRILAVASRYGIPVVEDAAEALGSCFAKKHCGTYGEMGILSFNGNKIITTSGGGALVSSEMKYTDEARFLATQAREDFPHYEHTRIGYNYRMSNMAAAIGRGQMEVLPSHLTARRKINQRYREMLANRTEIGFLTEPDNRFFSNYWLTTIMIHKKNALRQREKVRLALDDMNIDARPLWKPMHLQPVFRKYPSYLNGVSEDLFNRGLCLPSGSALTVDDMERVTKVIQSVLR
jgi:dTDP-4-amino-4,6-dideoxygalactose transaminase